VVWMVWQYYGDTAVIERHLPNLDKYMEFLETQFNTSKGGMKHFWPTCIPGWITIGEVPDCSTMTGVGCVT
jgi:hypothetical protein